MKFEIDFIPEYCLKKSGYRSHKNGLIREDGGNGRFHAFVTGFNEVDLHYDKYIKGMHTATNWSYNLNWERNRIKKITKNLVERMGGNN